MKICEDTNRLNATLSSVVTNLQIMVASARSVGWGRNEAVIPVSHNLYKCSDVQYGNTRFSNISDQRHWPDSPFTQHIFFCFLYCSSGLWTFCWAIILLTYVAATKIWIYDELDRCHITHILFFITPNFLPNCRMIIAALAIFQTWITVRVSIGKFLFDILSTKSECSGCMLAYGWLAVTLRPVMDWLL